MTRKIKWYVCYYKKYNIRRVIESDGNTSFLRAARAGHLDKVLEHLKSNIDINTSNANGLNALHLASKDGHLEVVAELLKRGAAVDAATKKGNTALHIASLAGQEEVVKLLVNHGASVNVQSQNGFTPLYMAAQENHDNVVKYLLANGANQTLATEDGFTPLAVAMQQGHDKVVTVLLENDTRGKVRLPALHIAAKKDDVKAAKLLLENDHNPDVTSKSGFTPLHIASHYGNEGIANLLIQKKADVNYAAKHNITPLHVAAKWGKTNMVAMLLEKGANIESKTRDGLTPLHCAARSGHEQVVDMLLERDAPISCKTKNGLAPLHMAAQGDHVDAARILLYHRAPVDEVTVDYLTALHVAAHCGHVRVAKLLLDRQADANARALNGFTPLHIACKKNRIKVVELLLKHGASISATTESGLTPLHVASFMGCMNIVIYLLQHDANPDVPTVRGETPLHLAARANQTDIIRILLRNGSQVDARAREQQTPLHIASRLGNVDIVMLLLQHGAKVDTATKDMYTALHIAAKEGQDEVAAVLIDNGASLNSTTKKGFTPLHLASKYGNIKVAKLLLQKEAPVDAQGKNGVTPLHVASHYDHQQVALLLLDKGASPHATAKNGHTPLHIAAKKNQMDIANTLLEYGAKPNAESKAGFTPLHLSAQEGHVDMTSLLIEHEADTNCQAKNGLTPLHLCAQEDRVPVAEVLVKNKAIIDKASKAGYTPLHVACHYGQSNMVKFLLNHGADVKSTTTIGYTPLHQAAQQGHTNIVNVLLENSAQPNAITHSGQTPLHIAQKLGYISVIDTLKVVTQPTSATLTTDEKYKVVAPEAMHETFMSDSEEEGGEDTMLGDHAYRYLTADEMKSLGDDSLPIDVTRDERIDSNRLAVSGDSNMLPPQAIEDSISPQQYQNNYSEYIKKYTPDNVDVARHPINIGKLHWKNFLVSFLVDARGGAMRGCRHSGVRVIVPPRSAGSPTRITCRYVRPQRTPHPPPLMEGEALASRVLELGPVGAKFLGPVIIEVPHFAALRGKEREIVILRSDNGETWREHTIDSSEDILNDVLNESFEAEDISQLEDVSSGRITRILTHDFPQYFAVVSRIRQEVHAIGPEGGMVSSTVVPQVQAVFPQGALTKKIKVGLQAQPIDPELTAKLLGHGVAVSPVVTVEPRRRKFHKAITLSMPAPRAHSQGMINQYSGSTPTLRLLCSITGGTTRAQWEDVTGSTPLTFVNDCVSFTTTVSARFWLMDCRNIGDATKMATELYREAIHVPFMAKFVVFAKRIDPLEARLRVFCMTDDKEDKTLEHQEHFTEVAKSRDVEVLEGKPQYVEFAGNLIPITKSGEQLQFAFRAFRENRLPFSVKVKDQHAEAIGRSLFMREAKVPKGDPPQQPICILNIVLPDDIVADTISLTDSDSIRRHEFLKDSYEYYRPDPRLADISNLLGEDWVLLATQLGLTTSEINVIKSEYPDSVAKQAQSMLRMWISQSSNRSQSNVLENALRRIGREDIIPQCLNEEPDIIKKEETVKYRIKKDISFEDRDIMKDSESVESLIQSERKEDRIKKRGSYDKYSAEEKVVEEPSDEEDFNKTVREKRELIEKRLSVERTIPASSQRVEIAQEISSIKRQSIVEDKIAEVETQKRLTPPEVKTIIDENIPSEKDTYMTTEQTIVKEITPEKQTTITTITTETRTIKETINLTHKTDEEKNDDLLENVAQRLETKKVVPKITTDADPRSPKLSKTPPPSPADFIIKEKAATVQEWEASREEAEEEQQLENKNQENIETGSVSLTYSTDQTLPQPIPRTSKVSNQLELLSPLETEISTDKITNNDSLITEIDSYSDRKKFWENVTKDNESDNIKKKTSPPEETQKTAEPDILMQPPIPKPRLHQNIQSNVESSTSDEDVVSKPLSEYQRSYQNPQDLVLQDEKRQNIIESKESIDSDNENSYQHNLSSGYENTGYISDSGDVEQYISDSEIEDRVPQIRERQMSVFQPPTPSLRKSIYERSCSLPTEDLYEVSAQSILLRKQMFEEQIKKDMVDDVLMTEIEEEPSPEHKTLKLPNLVEEEEPSGVKSVPESAVCQPSDFPEMEKLNNKISLMEKAEALILDEDYDVDNNLPLVDKENDNFKDVDMVNIIEKASIADNQALILEEQQSGKIVEHTIDTRSDKITAQLEESLEMHVDKSEIEASEKKIEISENDIQSCTDDIPEITVSLSGIQKRISEESDEAEDKDIAHNFQTTQRSEAGSPINHPEECLQETVWEVSIQSQPQTYEEVVTDIQLQSHGIVEKDDDFSGSVRDESDLGSEIHQDHSESYGSDHRSDSQADIEKLILESLHHQKISPEEAKLIASELVADIEAEIHQRGSFDDKEPPAPEYAKNQVSDYLRQLAEAKGLDSREVQLVQSVLARKQREITKLSRGDTQASSIEITDEDLRYSGNEISPSCSLSNILEEQIDKLEEQKIKNNVYDSDEIEEPISTKLNITTNKVEAFTVERSTKEHKDVIFEEDEITLDSGSERTENTQKSSKDQILYDEEVLSSNKEDKMSSKLEETTSEQMSTRSYDNLTSTITENDMKVQFAKEMEEDYLTTTENLAYVEKSSRETLKDKIIEENEIEVNDTISITDENLSTKIDNIDHVLIDNGVERRESAHIESIKQSKTETFVEDSHKESIIVSTQILSDLTSVDVENILESKIEIIGSNQIFSDDSKSSEESFKSPEDFMSTSSSKKEDDESKLQKDEVVFRKVKRVKDESSSTSSNLKPDRKSGIDFETYSSSGESHYQSFEIDSNKSRPCSSDIDVVIAAGSSDYESALTSQDLSAPLHLTSTEYHTAVSSISSKESMKSLDSESSGNLASVEVSEASETLVPSEFEFCVDGSEESKLKSNTDVVIQRQNTDLSESEIPFDTHQSLDLEEEFSTNVDIPSKMKRSQEMTFQPEPKSLVPDSPHFDNEDSGDIDEKDEKLGASVEDGSILSMSLSSTSSINAQRTVIELSHTDSEKLDAGMSMSNLSEQLSFEDSEYIGSRENLSFTPTINTTNEMSTSTQMLPQTCNVNNVTLTTSVINENGIQSAGTQVVTQINTTSEFTEQKKRGHRRTDSTTFVSNKFTGVSSLTEIEKKIQSDLAESDKYTHPLSLKESDSFDKKDFGGESYETEADQGLHRDISEGKYAQSELDDREKKNIIQAASSSKTENLSSIEQFEIKCLDENTKITQDVTKKTYKDILDKRDSHGKSSSNSSEKSSFEEAEAEAAFNMVAHTSPAHKIKQICPIMEDEDAEKHELETREKAQKDLEKRIAQLKDQSPGAIPDIKVTQHMTPLDRKGFHYPDLELEEKEIDMIKSTPETPASNSSKSSESTDQGHEYVIDDSETSIPEESESQIQDEKTATDSKSEIISIIEKTIQYETDKETVSPTESPNSDSFEILEKPDIMDEFVVIEEVAKEAQETDMEGKSLKISRGKISKKHDEEVEQLLVRSAPSPSTKMTDIKYYPDGSSSDELGFDFEDSPPGQKGPKGSTSPRDYVYEYDKELEANKKWIEQQFQGDHAAMIAAGYGYEMDFERCPLEDIKEEDGNDFDSSRIGSLNSQKESGGSFGSVKDSYSSTPEYDVLAGRRYFTKSGEHDDVSMSSLQEFENLERAMSLETRKFHQGSQDSSSNGSFKTRYFGRSGQGDDISVSSLKEFEGLEKACIAAHKVEIKVKEEEMLLTQIDEGAESMTSESESCETITSLDNKVVPESDEEDYEKRMFEIDEIIRQAQTNVERFIDLKDGERTESIGRGDSVEEVSKIPDLELDIPIAGGVKVKWNDGDDIMQASIDSLDVKADKPSHHGSADSLDQKTGGDIMTASTDSIEFQAQKNRSGIVADSLDFREPGYTMTSSDSLELATGSNIAAFSDSIDEDGSKLYGYDQSSSSTGKDLSAKEDDYFVDNNKVLCDLLESTDSIASTSAGTHATYQYETDSVFSGSFTSGGSNTMVSSTDNIETTLQESVNIADAVKKVWFEDQDYLEDGKPYVTEIIEPGESDITRYTFKGPDVDQKLKQFIDNFNEGETVHEERTVDPDGSIHIKRTVQNRVILKDNIEKVVLGDGLSKTTVIDNIGVKTIYSQDFKSSEDYNTAVQSILTTIAGECSGETSSRGTRQENEKQSGSQAESDEAFADVETTIRSATSETINSKQTPKPKEETDKE